MTKVSRIKVDEGSLRYFLNNFWSTITLLENKEQVRFFLQDLLTHTEMKMLAKRLQIAKMLLEGYNYRDIKGGVKVTDSTISKISNSLETGGEGLKIALKHLWDIERRKENNRMKVLPDLKKKYGIYYMPEKIMDEVNKKLNKTIKNKSATKSY